MQAIEPRTLTDPCGRFLPALVFHDLHDRLHGHRARANARWGWLTRPAPTGKLIWVIAGSTRPSVRLGVELARAIVGRRLDVSVTLTFETEYPELLAPLALSARAGWGFGPADYAGSMNAVWRRLLPFGLVLAGITPRPNLLRACEATRHAVLVAPPATVAGRFERIYPAHAAPCPGANSAAPVDLDTLLTQAQVEPSLIRMVNGDVTRGLWWWHGSDPAAAKRFFALFRGHLPDDVLFVSGPVCQVLATEQNQVQTLSAWGRTCIPTGTLVLADDPVWIPAVAACATGVHFALEDSDALWQALAGGASVSAVGAVDIASPNALGAVGLMEDENEVIRAWVRLSADPIERRIAADAARRAFWAERRTAYDTVAELLGRVFEWS